MVIFHGELLNNQMVQECGNCIQDLDFQSALFDGNVFLKAGCHMARTIMVFVP